MCRSESGWKYERDCVQSVATASAVPASITVGAAQSAYKTRDAVNLPRALRGSANLWQAPCNIHSRSYGTRRRRSFRASSLGLLAIEPDLKLPDAHGVFNLGLLEADDQGRRGSGASTLWKTSLRSAIFHGFGITLSKQNLRKSDITFASE